MIRYLMSWRISWNFDNEYLRSGKISDISISITNLGGNTLFLGSIKLLFDFGLYDLNYSGPIAGGTTFSFRRHPFEIPNIISGQHTYQIEVIIHDLDNGIWVDQSHTIQKTPINVFLSNVYTVFLSRGIGIEDRIIGDSIANIIRQWGFRTKTVGIEVQVLEQEVVEAIDSEIEKADAVIAIVTPRFITSKGLKKTFEWAHAEIAIGHIKNKPMLIFNQHDVNLNGIPSYLALYNNIPKLDFDPRKLLNFFNNVNCIMPSFRNVIEDKRWNDFVTNVGNLALTLLAGVGLGFLGCYFMGNFDKKSN